MPTEPGVYILLHLLEFPLLLSLLGVQLMNLGLEAPLVLPKPLVV
jgi:hypothetical protein